MEQFKRIIFDIETDGLLEEVTKIHCLSYSYEEEEEVNTLTDINEIKHFFLQDDVVFVGHYITLYDIPIIEKLLGINVVAKLIDTCALSWYLEPQRSQMKISHGLEKYGEEFGIKKPIIENWTNLSIAEYSYRCSEDVKINRELWKRQKSKLLRLYNNDIDSINRIIDYLMFKMKCVKKQIEVGLKLDVELCETVLKELEAEKERKVTELIEAMPKIAHTAIRVYPKVFYKKDGSLSSHGEKWIALCKEHNLPEDHREPIEIVLGYEEGNPNSPDQLKKWLYSLGWEPEHIKQVRDKKDNSFRDIPQIASKEGGGEVCPSVLKLIEKEPAIEALNGLSVISHRIGIFKGFLENQINGRLYPSMKGFTNTLRLQHQIVVNLPGVDKMYGEQIRGALVADENHVLCCSDLSNIEDRTKRHYIYKYDPKYVEDMNVPGYDAHLELGILAGFLQEEEAGFYKKIEKEKDGGRDIPETDLKQFKRIKEIRQKSKVANFSATYKVGAKTLSKNSGLSLKDANKLLEIYWQRNKAILEVENSLFVKTVFDQKWLFNPVSKFWYSLRVDKDKFSTLNQGTAVYVFDLYLMALDKMGINPQYQCHDEWVANIQIGKEKDTSKIIEEAMDIVNTRLKLNIQVGAGCQFGINYAEIH